MSEQQLLHVRLGRSKRIRSAMLIAAAVCGFPNMATRAAEPSETTRWEFRDAYAEAQRGVTDAAYSIALQNYILFPYLQAARLRALLAENQLDPEAILQSTAATHSVRVRRLRIVLSASEQDKGHAGIRQHNCPLYRILVFRGMMWSARQPIDRLAPLVPIGARFR